MPATNKRRTIDMMKGVNIDCTIMERARKIVKNSRHFDLVQSGAVVE